MRVFFEKTRNVGAVGRESYKFTGMLHAFYLKKHTESGRVSATHVLVEKRYGIRERLVAGHMNLQSQVTRNARRIFTEKTQGIWGELLQRAFFIEKHSDFSGRWRERHVNLQSK